jgi:hypothetical protein
MLHKIHNGGSIAETRFVHDGGVCIQELTSTGEVSTAFVCTDGLQEAFSTSGVRFFVNRGLNHWGDRGVCPGGSRQYPHAGNFVAFVADSSGLPVERFDYDDACKPIFLDATGVVRPGATSAVGPIKWMAPEARWVPETGMFHCPGGVYSPDLGTQVSEAHNPFNNAPSGVQIEIVVSSLK